MNKGNLRGWKDIFTFTLTQTLKSKTFIISYVILIVLAMVSMPVISLITGGASEEANDPNPVKKVYVNNKTELPNMDFEELKKDERFKHIVFQTIREEYDVITKRIQEEEKEAIILTIVESEGNYSLSFIKSSNSSIKNAKMQVLADSIVPQFEAFKMKSLGIKDEQLAMIHAEIKTEVSMADVNGVEIIEEDTSISYSEYWFIYGILFIVLMVNIMASTQIATAIVTEKSTRVLEYLLTSVKPLAIMVGKIIAMLLAVLIQVISMITILVVSNKVSAAIFSSDGESVLSKYLPKDMLQNLNLINIVICLLLIILGMIFYATLAGLAGATVSRIEEVGEGLTLFTFTNMVGAYTGIGAIGILMGKGINGFVTFAFLFPLSSPFILPGAILIGKVSLSMIAVAILLQIIFISLLFKFVAKVYETLILHYGNKIKIKELIKISKTV